MLTFWRIILAKSAEAASDGVTAHRGVNHLTQDLSSLAGSDETLRTFDVVIIGSGYGAAVSTFHLSKCKNADGKPLKICVLERGLEYLAGSFPKDASELPGHVRVSSGSGTGATGKFEGLFDVRVNSDVSSLIANGFGGGSLINAGVMIRPLPKVINDNWPMEFEDLPFTDTIELLGAKEFDHSKLPRKYDELKKLAAETKPALITVFPECNSCGNCATGCNFGHKASLDRTLFEQAKAFNSELKFITGATVDRFEQDNDEFFWVTQVLPTRGDVRARTEKPYRIKSRQLIVAAGTFGSTELLMKSESDALEFSSALGQGFSSNGDMLAVGYHRDVTVNAIARSGLPGNGTKEDVGPTITGVADFRESHNILLQEMHVPFPIANFFDEIFSTSAAITATTKWDLSIHHDNNQQDPFSLNATALKNTSVYAMMSDDGANGEITIPKPNQTGDGYVTVKWPELKQNPIFPRQIKFLKERSKAVGGTVIANPLWQPLPEAVSFLAGDQGPLMTVHPLGGCRMAKDVNQGVVSQFGEVFNRQADGDTSVHEGLVVLDGAIIPTALGANPALTISTVANRAIRHLSETWGYSTSEQKQLIDRKPWPVFRAIKENLDDTTTKVELVERMTGDIKLGNKNFVIEFTMRSNPTELKTLVASTSHERVIELGPKSTLRFFDEGKYQKLMLKRPGRRRFESYLDEKATARFEISGKLTLFPRGPTEPVSRFLGAFKAFMLNRGIRDSWQGLFDKSESIDGSIIATLLPALSHAGEKRTMNYDLKIEHVLKQSLKIALKAGDSVSGKKTITYRRPANPLRQMSEMSIDRLGNESFWFRKPMVSLQPEYLARQSVPLLRVAEQNNAVDMLLDFMKVGGYLTRMLFSIHASTFRLPDTYRQPPLSRLPARIPGVSDFEQIQLKDQDGEPLPALLTRYEVKGGKPLLLFHGYSASGTTFAHEALPEPFARYMVNKGYDVWILDARTSSGLHTAQEPWTFEEVGTQDFPQRSNTYIARPTKRSISSLIV